MTAEADCLVAQNNAAAAAEQRLSGRGAAAGGWRDWSAAIAPWLIHLLWLAAGVELIVYLKSHEWGWFGPLLHIIAAVIAMSAWLEWTVAWSLLARRHVVERVVYFVAGMLAILVVADWIIEWRRNEPRLLWALAVHGIGCALPLALVYWRGWRITRQLVGEPPRASIRWSQFSLAEALLLTTGASLWLGLLALHHKLLGTLQPGDITALHLVLACGTLLVVVGMAARRFLAAITIALAICAALIAGAIAWFNPDAPPLEWLHFGLISLPALVGLVASICLARWCGYRLAPNSPPAGGG